VNKFARSLLFLFVPLVTAYGQDANGTSTVTFGLGAGRPIQHTGISGGPQLNGNYEYRLSKHWALEFGVNTTLVTAPTTVVTATLPAGTTLGTYSTLNYAFNYSTKQTFAASMPFGLKGMWPLAQGRLELFAGGGGTHLWNPNPYGTVYGSGAGGFGLQGTLGARMAIDKQRRFWLGSTGRFTAVNRAYPSQWITWTADLGFRFGH